VTREYMLLDVSVVEHKTYVQASLQPRPEPNDTYLKLQSTHTIAWVQASRRHGLVELELELSI
jgi:hypothetical protein